VSVWEVLLLPLRCNSGQIDRLIGCLHPVRGWVPPTGEVPLRFTIDEMSIRPVGEAAGAAEREAMPLAAGFAESPVGFEGPRGTGLTAIEGGLKEGEAERPAGKRPKLRVVKDEE
jgi:hypothetical protein